MSTLFVAAGGGGDAVAILLAQRLIAPSDPGPPAIATCAWERLIVDPVPGPRRPAGFVGLREHGGVSEVVADSDTVPLGRSMLPRLVRETGARVFLLDLSRGVPAMADQLRAAAAVVDADRIVAVDSGGDAVATGTEPSLKSPLADAMGVAGAIAAGLPVTLAVIGPGADGELTESEVLGRLSCLGAGRVGDVGVHDVERVRSLLSWHPTEASSIVAAAALGERPVVALRRGGSPMVTTDSTPGVWVVEPRLSDLPLADAVSPSESLDAAAAVMATLATDELRYEREKAAGAASGRVDLAADPFLPDLRTGATHVTLRRARELTGDQHPIGVYGHALLTVTEFGLRGLALAP